MMLGMVNKPWCTILNLLIASLKLDVKDSKVPWLEGIGNLK
jgi:hypothetical protein